jgi:hypothetical protein
MGGALSGSHSLRCWGRNGRGNRHGIEDALLQIKHMLEKAQGSPLKTWTQKVPSIQVYGRIIFQSGNIIPLVCSWIINSQNFKHIIPHDDPPVVQK